MTTQADKAHVFLTRWLQLAPRELDALMEIEYEFAKPAHKYRADFAFPCAWLIVEIDGGQWVKNGGRHNRDSDRVKINKAVESGWRVLRYSPDMLDNDPQAVIDQVLRCIEKWSVKDE